jgi:hypothetical protein
MIKICSTCRHWQMDVCVNGDSEWVADFRLRDDTCNEWEARTNDAT